MCRHYRRPLVDLLYCSFVAQMKRKKKIQNYQQRKKNIFPFDIKVSNVNSETILINRKLWKVFERWKFRN